MANSIITQKLLQSQLSYNSETGIFTRLVSNKKQFKIGDIAGSVHSDGYIVIHIFYEKYRAHRLAWLYMTGEIPEKHIDHIDGNKANNSFSNLRLATNKQNLKNRLKNINNKSGFRGVSWSVHAEKWIANAMLNGKRKNLGYFATAEKAAKAFNSFAKLHYGEFYNAN